MGRANRRHALAALTILAAFSIPGVASAQPSGQPIKIIYPYAAGGSGDALIRLVADRLQADLNQSVIVENRTGGAGMIGVNAVKNSPNDGSTFLFTPFAVMTIYPFAYKKLDYDPVKDFKTVSQLVSFDFGIAVGPQVPAKNVKELVAWLKANPNQANYGSPGAGALPHFFGLMFGEAVGVKMNHIPYRGTAPALTDVLSGAIPMVSSTVGDLMPQHKQGKVRMIGTSDEERSEGTPDVPTFKESGINITGSGWYGMFAPAGTPDAIIAKVQASVAATLKRPDIREKLAPFGFRITGTTPTELAAIQKADMEKWGPIVKASGFSAD